MLTDYLTRFKSSFKSYTELRAHVNTTQNVGFINGNLVSNTRNSIGGVSARVYKNGVFGFASGSTYTEDSVGDVVKSATDNAVFMDSRAKKGKPPLADTTMGQFEAKHPGNPGIPAKVIIEYLADINNYIEKKYPNLEGKTLMVSCLDIEKRLVVSGGADACSYLPRSILMAQLTTNTAGGSPVNLTEVIGGYGIFTEQFSDPALRYCQIDDLYEKLMQKRDGVFADAGMKNCIMHADLAGILAHEAVGHTVEADIVLGGSVAAHNVGKPVASELVSLVDFANTAFGKLCPIPVYVDDEGVIAEDAVIIENGILKSFMNNRETAAHFGVKPQGNARAFTFSDEPLIRMRNTAILPGKSKLQDMIESIDDGYYLVKTGNGQADTTGEFMFSIELGYEIKGGKLGRAIRETTISGMAFEMLKTVDQVSDDMNWMCGGFCGKKQPMVVGMGGPAIKCKVNIGGR